MRSHAILYCVQSTCTYVMPEFFFSFLAKFITHDITYGDTRVCLRDTCMQASNLCVITPEDMPFTDVSRFFAIHMLTRVER